MVATARTDRHGLEIGLPRIGYARADRTCTDANS